MPSLPHPESIIRLVQLRKRFGRNRVLDGISLDFPVGMVTVVLGPSGCGKSVMLKHVIGLMRPDRGEVHFDDIRVDTLSEPELTPVRRQIGFLFQQGALFDSMTVGDNVAFPLTEHTRLDPEASRARVLEVLAMVGLQDTVDKMPADLSGGQQKRIALARAIVLNPRVILYDEPTTGLDPIRADVINKLIVKLQRELKITSIVVTHDLTSAFEIADRMVLLYHGQVVMQGTPDELRNSTRPIVQRFLTGEATPDELAGIQTIDASSTIETGRTTESRT